MDNKNINIGNTETNNENIKIVGDRECPSCLNISLIEKSMFVWKCTICKEEFDEDYLDDNN